MTKKLIIVSNRLPISVTKTASGLTFGASSGGLATAMSSLNYSGEKLWIGWPGIVSEDLTPQDKVAITKHLKQHGYVPVYLSRAEIEGFYEGYSNDTLWPLFHYFPSFARFSSANYQAYQAVNKHYLRAVRRHLSAESTVWVHDYHLMLLPRMIRAICATASIGFFLHIPFPSYEIFRNLPERKALLRGLLGADLIGFHIYDYARHFLSSSLRLLGVTSKQGQITYNGRKVIVDSFPIGIDYEKFTDSLTQSQVQTAAQKLREQYGTQKIIMSVDRLDYSKGIPERLEAFSAFLQKYPQWHRKVSMVMIAVPSRTEVETYKVLRDQIEQTVGRINGTYGSIDWTPISYQFRNLDFTDIVALYSEADIALVTPLRDGMNLVAKEYVAAKQRKNGVLILSEMAGAIDELPEALAVNPYDCPSLVTAIHTALTMSPTEQRRRMRTMQRRIAHYTVARWGQDFIEQLHGVKHLQDTSPVKLLLPEQQQSVTSKFHAAKQRIIMLDYDGTLRPFVSSRQLSKARPSRQLLALLNRLASLPNTTVYIISGRDKTTLQTWFGATKLRLVAEHGAYAKLGNTWQSADVSFEASKQLLLPLLTRYVDRTAGAVLEIKDYSLVWHYRDVPTELAYSRTADLRHDLQSHIKDTPLSICNGNKALEVKLTEITKGAVAKRLAKASPGAAIIAIGDDLTDEDMFAALPASATTVHVGDNDTCAKHLLPDVDSVLAFLRRIVD